MRLSAEEHACGDGADVGREFVVFAAGMDDHPGTVAGVELDCLNNPLRSQGGWIRDNSTADGRGFTQMAEKSLQISV